MAIFAAHNKLIVVGGESAAPNTAHEEVHLFDSQSQQWLKKPSLIQGRHGSGIIAANG
ncbi:kelch repeat-containing protein [Shewanella sp. UCD-KL21]|uniref:kelch repeat-containing protein n=1 Tax=Shewanella sp. UCD-KL21 TaxID=1917164 RepID=UPI0009711905|nr:kelch repeat-containing protein [Shewanella sp. UCD-KL21]